MTGKRDTDNSDDRRKKRTERKTRRGRRLQKDRKILLKSKDYTEATREENPCEKLSKRF
jgi:hypothetical protein